MAELDKALRLNGYIFQDSLYVKYNDNETVSRVRLPLDARGTVFLKKYASKEEFNKSQFCSNDVVTDVLTLLSVLLEHVQDETL